MSEAIVEENNLGDLLRYEQDKNFCREVVSVASADGIKAGTILAKKADDTWGAVSLTAAASEETESAKETESVKSELAVALFDAETWGTKTSVVVLARNGIVAKNGLIYPEEADEAAKKKIDSDLKAVGILVREDI